MNRFHLAINLSLRGIHGGLLFPAENRHRETVHHARQRSFLDFPGLCRFKDQHALIREFRPEMGVHPEQHGFERLVLGCANEYGEWIAIARAHDGISGKINELLIDRLVNQYLRAAGKPLRQRMDDIRFECPFNILA